MAITKEQKKLFSDKVRDYKSCVDDIKKEVSTLKVVGRKNAKVMPYVQVRLAVLGLQRANTLVLMSRLSMEIQNLKNETYLNDARKELSNNLNELLKMLGDDLDSSLTDNKEVLVKIARISPAQKYHLLLGFQETTQKVTDSLGETSKWRWSFPDLYFKMAILSKNIFDFTEYDKKSREINDEFQVERRGILQFMTEVSQQAAQEYRSKFELSTHEVSDLQAIQRLFEFLRKVYSLTGNAGELDKIRTALDSVNEKVETAMADKKKKKKK